MLFAACFALLVQYLWVGALFVPRAIAFWRWRQDVSRFEVHSLPDAPALPRSWAGRIPVPNAPEGNALFFWLFEAEDAAYDDNLIMWFNGGPGCASLIGASSGNGPLTFVGNTTDIKRNPYSWTKLGNVLYIDQPVGTGLSTASNPYPVTDNELVTEYFYSWLGAFFEHFPALVSKRVHMIGESYAGIYIPYFARRILDNRASLPLDLRSVSLGDGTWGNNAAMSAVSIGAYIRSQHRLLDVPPDILTAYADADNRCGFTTVMHEANQYPPQGPIRIPGDPEYLNFKKRKRAAAAAAAAAASTNINARSVSPILNDSCDISPTTPAQVMQSIFNSTCYGPCATFATAMDYFDTANACFNVYDIATSACAASVVDPKLLLAEYFSRADVQAALNIPSSPSTDAVVACNATIMYELLTSSTPIEPPAYAILPALVSVDRIPLHFYSGNLDMLINHLGAELCLQNMTWRGGQGFSHRPSQVFYPGNAAPSSSSSSSSRSTSSSASSGGDTEAAGIWIAERGVSYHLFWGAGHSVVTDKPAETFSYLRDIVLA